MFDTLSGTKAFETKPSIWTSLGSFDMMTEWVRSQLASLGDLNSSCSIHLHRLLRKRADVRLWADNAPPATTRGTAVFAAFDPWDTCLRIAPRSFRYFNAAERRGLISMSESLDISKVLLRKASKLKEEYRGHFSYFFDQPKVASFLAAKDDQELLDLENTFGACADVFYEAVPWPVHPDRHLIATTSNETSFDGTVSLTKIDELNDAIELASWGPWINLKPDAICNLIDPNPKKNKKSERIKGQRISMPFFSHGLQGVVAGFFANIENSDSVIDEKIVESVSSELMQFGQTLADKWFILRSSYFWQTVRDYQGDVSKLASALVYMCSPIDYAVAEIDGRIEGYKLHRENGYWAGYHKLNYEQAYSLLQEDGDIIKLSNVILPKSNIAIKTLQKGQDLDVFFAKTRIEMLLRDPICFAPPVKIAPLTLIDVMDKLNNLKERWESGHKSLSTLRQIYVLGKIVDHFDDGSVSISNNELKNHLERESMDAKSGYQISSHSGEIQRLFENGLVVERSRSGLNLSWAS